MSLPEVTNRAEEGTMKKSITLLLAALLCACASAPPQQASRSVTEAERDRVQQARELLLRVRGAPDEVAAEIDRAAERAKTEARERVILVLADVPFEQLLELLDIVDMARDRRTRWLAFAHLLAWVEDRERPGQRRAIDPAKDEELERLFRKMYGVPE